LAPDVGAGHSVAVAFTAYRDLLRAPSVAWLLATSLLGRLPFGMVGLAVLLAVTQGTGSYGRAGLVTAAYVVGSGLAQPFVGRAMDRRGRRWVLVPVACANAVLLITLALSIGAPIWALLAVAVLAGATQPPLAAAVRSLWPVLLTGPRRESVFALEATMQELTFIAGPALVAGLAVVWGPRVALATVGVIALVGTLGFVRDPAVATVAAAQPEHPHRGGALRSLPLRRLMAVAVSIVAALSMVDLGVVASVSGPTASASAGLALAVWSAGSLVGGLAYGARRTTTQWPLWWMVLAVSLHFAVLALATNTLVLIGLLFLGGTTVAPTLARLYSEVGESVPERVAAEAFSWVAASMLAGSSIGSAVGGWTVELSSARWCFLVAALLTTVGSLAVHRLPRRPAAESVG
jgi:MFS family permease